MNEDILIKSFYCQHELRNNIPDVFLNCSVMCKCLSGLCALLVLNVIKTAFGLKITFMI